MPENSATSGPASGLRHWGPRQRRKTNTALIMELQANMAVVADWRAPVSSIFPVFRELNSEFLAFNSKSQLCKANLSRVFAHPASKNHTDGRITIREKMRSFRDTFSHCRDFIYGDQNDPIAPSQDKR